MSYEFDEDKNMKTKYENNNSSLITHNSKVPVLRFPEFVREWEEVNFGELSEFQQGVQVDVEFQTKEPKEGFIKFIRIENYTQNSTDFRYIPQNLSSNKFISDNEIAIVRYGATAGFIGRGFNGVLANNLFKLLTNKKLLDTEYLFQILKSDKVFNFFQSEMAGGAMPALSFGIVRVLKLPLTSLPEQQKIADFLSQIDRKIERLTQKKKGLERYKKGVMQQIFSQQLRFKDDNGQDFPEWEKKILNEFCDITTGKSNRQDSTLIGKYTFFDRSQDIRTSDIYLFDCEAIIIAGEGQEFIPKYFIGKFDLHQRTYAVIGFNGQYGKYLFYYIHHFRHYFLSQAVGSTVKSLRLPMFQKMPIQLPCLEEQTKIANFLTALDTKITLVSKQLNGTKQYKKGLLQQLFV